MGYEIWDRYERALIDDFDDQDAAFDYLRELVRTMKVGEAVQELDRMQLVRVSDNGTTTDVIAAGAELVGLIFRPAVAEAHY